MRQLPGLVHWNIKVMIKINKQNSTTQNKVKSCKKVN